MRDHLIENIENSSELKNLFKNFDDYLRYLPDMEDFSWVEKYHTFRIGEILKDKRNYGLKCVSNKDEIDGYAVMEMLDYDTEIFGRKMARITYFYSRGDYEQKKAVARKLLKEVLKEAKSRGIKHLNIRVRCQDIALVHSLEEMGFRLMDTVNVYAQRTCNTGGYECENKCLIKEATMADIEFFKKIIISIYSNKDRVLSRYYLDPTLDDELCGEFYLRWFSNCINSQNSGGFVLEEDGSPKGILAYKYDEHLSSFASRSIGYFTLSFIDPAHWHKKLFFCFRASVLKRISSFIDIIISITHPTNPIQGIMIKTGGRIIFSAYTFHYWI